MKFTNDQLQKMISAEIVGDVYPYITKDKDQIEKYIRDLFFSFNCSRFFQCEAIFDHYGSGYASYVDFFCYRKDGSSIVDTQYIERDSLTSIQIEGLVIYISRLAPVAIIGKDERHKAIIDTEELKDEFFSGMSMISKPHEVISASSDFWIHDFREIKQKLEYAGYSILEKEYLSQSLPFKAKIPTFTDPRQYKVFDAIFYWMD